MGSGYHAVYESWRTNPERFWAEVAEEIDWFAPADRVFDPDAGAYGRWLVGATTNTCHNCLDRHVAAGRAAQTAIIADSPVTGTQTTYSYGALLGEVKALAAVLADQGVGKGDRVIVYMPMIAEALMAMLACARLGAIHSVVFGGFSGHELAARIDDATPKLIIAASCGIEPNRIVAYGPMLDEAMAEASHKPQACLMLQRRQLEAELAGMASVDFTGAMEAARREARDMPCVPVAATDPLYILYTSGTTGKPKGVVRDNGGHMVALQWSMKNIYGIEPGEVFWAASDIGWVVGHSYIVYAPLLHGNTTVVFEGKPVGAPDAGTFWRVVAEHRVAALFTAPTALRAIRREDPGGAFIGKHDLASLRTLFLAGERADPATVEWARDKLGVPVVDHWWQTETGWTIAGNPVGLGMLPVKPGSPAVAMPGYHIDVLDNAGRPVGRGELGNIVIRLPLPPSCLPTLWNADERFRETYLGEFPGFYKTSDAGYMDGDGYLFIMARTDDIINVAGHRLSTGAMEEAIAYHPDVAECAVVGIADQLKGQLPAGFLVLNSGVERPPDEIEAEVVRLVRERIGPVAAFRLAIAVKRLPKTRSGKILRGTIRKIADGKAWKMPATIDDPAILDEIAATLAARGYAGARPFDLDGH